MPPVRDKRYTEPELFIDLFEVALNVTSWSRHGLLLPLGEKDFVLGQTFSGVLSFDEWDDAHGLFNATITDISKEEAHVTASFTWMDRNGRAMFDMIDELAKTGVNVPKPMMRLSIARRTKNWSLTGLLVDHEGQGLEGQGRLFGMIRAEKADEPAFFRAAVIRADADKQSLALKFVAMGDETFRTLETVMKKRRAMSA